VDFSCRAGSATINLRSRRDVNFIMMRRVRSANGKGAFPCMGLAVAAVLAVPVLAQAPGEQGATEVEEFEFPLLPAECGSATRGSVNIAGCPVLDRRIDRTPLDSARRAFELWCVDRGLLGLRFVQEDADGRVVDEQWVGVCPYRFAENRCTLKRCDGRWISSHYRSRDTEDDDKDGKVDRVRFSFDVKEGRLTGKHDNDSIVDVTRVWHSGTEAEARIPGDPASTKDGPVDLIRVLPAGGNVELLRATCDESGADDSRRRRDAAGN
jgi:hypothetical protein